MKKLKLSLTDLMILILTFGILTFLIFKASLYKLSSSTDFKETTVSAQSSSNDMSDHLNWRRVY